LSPGWDPREGRGALTSFLIASLLVAGSFLWLGDVGINLMDEGFLWYGVVRTRLGEVPIRDFQAYEPGRYYWAAVGAWLLGPGIIGLRVSSAAFLALGLTCGLQVAGRVIAHPVWRVAVALLLLAWSFPRHKLFEPALAMAAVWVGVRLAERPVWRRHLQAGAFVGFAACFGRNHALYTGLGLAAVLLWSYRKRSGRLRAGGYSGRCRYSRCSRSCPGISRASSSPCSSSFGTARISRFPSLGRGACCPWSLGPLRSGALRWGSRFSWRPW
jgi:hypothetical protein